MARRGLSRAAIDRNLREKVRQAVYGAKEPETVALTVALERMYEVKTQWEFEKAKFQKELDKYAKKVQKVENVELPALLRHHQNRDFGLWLNEVPNVYYYANLRIKREKDVIETALCSSKGCREPRLLWRIFCNDHDSDRSVGLFASRYLRKAKDYMVLAKATEPVLIKRQLEIHCMQEIERFKPDKWTEPRLAEVNNLLQLIQKDLIKAESALNKDKERFVFDMATRIRVLRKSDFRCVHCAADLHEIAVHIDHITPLSRGGSNVEGNLQALCGPCNLKKGNRFIG